MELRLLLSKFLVVFPRGLYYHLLCFCCSSMTSLIHLQFHPIPMPMTPLATHHRFSGPNLPLRLALRLVLLYLLLLMRAWRGYLTGAGGTVLSSMPPRHALFLFLSLIYLLITLLILKMLKLLLLLLSIFWV